MQEIKKTEQWQEKREEWLKYDHMFQPFISKVALKNLPDGPIEIVYSLCSIF